MKIPIIDFSEIIMLLLMIFLYIGILILGKHKQKSIIPGILLLSFILILIGHAGEYLIIDKIHQLELTSTLVTCIAWDLLFIFLSVIAYLWVDEEEVKAGKKKSIDDNLKWFWSKN